MCAQTSDIFFVLERTWKFEDERIERKCVDNGVSPDKIYEEKKRFNIYSIILMGFILSHSIFRISLWFMMLLPGIYIRPVMKNGKACFFDFSMTEPLSGPVLIP